MSLNHDQLVTLKAAILADPNLTTYVTAGATGAICEYYRAPSAGFYVWNSNTPVQSIYDSINWANFTPVDTPDSTTTWTNRSLACQGKQFNLQTLLQGRESLNATKANIRAGLQDALTAIPSGAGGASKSGGWSAVQDVMKRLAANGEKLFATGTGTSASPAIAMEGVYVDEYDVVQALTQI